MVFQHLLHVVQQQMKRIEDFPAIHVHINFDNNPLMGKFPSIVERVKIHAYTNQNHTPTKYEQYLSFLLISYVHTIVKCR